MREEDPAAGSKQGDALLRYDGNRDREDSALRFEIVDNPTTDTFAYPMGIGVGDYRRAGRGMISLRSPTTSIATAQPPRSRIMLICIISVCPGERDRVALLQRAGACLRASRSHRATRTPSGPCGVQSSQTTT